VSNNLTRQELPPEDLGDLTAVPERGAGLAGLIDDDGVAPAAPVSDRPGAAVPGPPAPSASLAPAPSSRPASAVRRPGRPRSRPKPTSAVYVSAGVKKRFEKYRHDSKSTNLQVVLQAISAKHTEGVLGEIIDRSRYSTAPVNELFPADPSAVRYLGGGSSQIAFSPTPQQEEVIDRIGKDLGFETRSTWIAPVLNAFLPGKQDAPGA
jgi:hypothetical protein